MALDMENKQLKARIQELMDDLEDKENQMILSAQLGKELLESNNELNNQLEDIQESNLKQVEELRQENYNLKIKFESNVLARSNFINEMENMKEKLEEKAKQELSRVNANHDKKIDELQLEIECLHTELEKSTLVTEQLQEKVSKQDEMLVEAHKYSKQLQGMGVLETQLEELKEECTLMRFKNDELKIIVADVNDEKQQLLFDQQNLMEKIEFLKENLEGKTTQGMAWYDALQDSREQMSELQMEVSTLKAVALNRSHKEKGNSLFGEVEDKRLALEQKYFAISTKYESLHKTHQIVKRQLHQLKTQILPMLQMAGNQADSSKIKRLEAALSQSRSEIHGCYVKIKDLEKESKEQGLSTRLENFHDAFTDFKDKKDYVAFLQNEIKRFKETIGGLKSEGEKTTMKLVAETGKRRETESVLHTCEVKKEKLEHEVVRLRLKLDELKIKLQQDGKSTELIREPTNARGTNRSIWKDVSLFTKTEKPKDTASENAPRQSVNQTFEAQSGAEAKNIKTNQSKVVESTEILPSKKAKPVVRVMPLNGEKKSVDHNVNEKLCPVAVPTVNAAPRVERKNTDSRKPVLLEHNQSSFALEKSTSDSISKINDNTQQQIPPGERTERTENVSIREDGEKAEKRQEFQQARRIHIKKDAGSKNECQQQ